MAAAAVGLGASPASAEDPPFVNWAALLPATVTGFTPDTFALCADGSPTCVQQTLAHMRSLLAELDSTCDHRALFLRNYVTVTEHYAALPPGFFDDDRMLAHEDAVFAKLYFDAFEAHRAGQTAVVPAAWRIAFDAARDRTVQGAGDLLLGINAHVQRDMPFMLAGLGLVMPDGRSRKPDHDRFNAVLNSSYDDVFRRATEVDDPMLALYDPPGVLDNTLAFQMIALWREGVWRNAERLVRATTPQERRFVADSIEKQAEVSALLIRETFAYHPPLTSTAARDAHCASHPADPGGGAPAPDLRRNDIVRVDLPGVRVRIRKPGL
jgi:hypothetical protein